MAKKIISILLLALLLGAYKNSLSLYAESKKKIINDKNLLLINPKRYKNNRIPNIHEPEKKSEKKTLDLKQKKSINLVEKNNNLSYKYIIITLVVLLLIFLLIALPKKTKKNK